jgi:hypothetical protein
VTGETGDAVGEPHNPAAARRGAAEPPPRSADLGASRTLEAKGVRMGDLKSERRIVAKGLMFLVIATAATGLILIEAPSIRVGVLLVLLVWASCRFYYFLFYVLEKYVDPDLRYAGLLALVGELWRSRLHQGGA